MVQYHEHNSLLEHVFDEELSEAEQKAAWESYNAEKAAETARYNFQVLHSRLEQSTSAPAAAAHPLSAPAAAPPPAVVLPPHITNIGDTLLSLLMDANNRVDTLTRTDQQKNQLTQILGGVCHPEEAQRANRELQRVNEELKYLYQVVSSVIQNSNKALTAFNQHQGMLPPHVTQRVAQLRQFLLQKIHALPRLDSATPVAVQGAGPAPMPPERYH